MIRVAVITALGCLAMATALLVGAFRRLGIARVAWRARSARLDEQRPGAWRFVGVLEPAGPLVTAPFTERASVYAHATLRGMAPDGGEVRTLWNKVLHAPVNLCDRDLSIPLDLASAYVLVAREYRIGALRALVDDVRIVPRVLSRAGYRSPPPSSQWFHLEEEVLVPGERVTVIAERDAAGVLRGVAGAPVVVSNLNPWRILLRVAWGPALAMMMALIVLITGTTVVVTYLWLR
ncbi:MAG: hypothetical protein WCJ30_01930 [Deltaproteobacteria bacterium]